MPKTSRLDVLIVERGLLASRQAAQAAIMDGGVLVDGNKVTKPGTPVKLESEIQLVGDWVGTRYVSRGGLKLERALQEFNIDPTNAICLDLGASTGGFTDCLLKHGAAKIYAIDVGYGQLDWGLRQDPRVVVKERTNARTLTAADLYAGNEPHATIAVADLSFISLTKVLPAAVRLLEPDDAHVVALVKPQFEAGRSAVGKGGVVRDKETHEAVLREVTSFTKSLGLRTIGITYSPVKGPAGNIEFLAYWRTTCDAGSDTARAARSEPNITAIVAAAHNCLNVRKIEP